MINPIKVSVTQVRIAASCPRIFYFDWEYTKRKKLKQPRNTLIWKAGADEVALGSVFHNAIESFNHAAGSSEAVQRILVEKEGVTAVQQALKSHIFHEFINQKRLHAANGAQQQGFISVLDNYISELSGILVYGIGQGTPIPEILNYMFGDKRKNVDVTFRVGKDGEGVRVVGKLDYVFYDFRNHCRRIIDYKLTPAHAVANDLFQVCIYSLMHNVQHKTRADAAVLYLHPSREMVEIKWEAIHGERNKIYNLLASMREWTLYDEKGGEGLKPYGEPALCTFCPYDKNNECQNRLGPKKEGGSCEHWKPSAGAAHEPEPETIVCDSETTPAPSVSPEKIELDSNRLFLGDAVDGFASASMPSSCLNTHTAVVGAAGSGKTWMAKVLVEEAILQGIPVLAVDPQGDLVQFLKPSDSAGESPETRSRFEKYWDRVEPRVYTPGSSHATRLCLNPIRLSRLDDLDNIDNENRRREELDSMLEIVAANLVALAGAGGEIAPQHAFLFQILKILIKTMDPEAIDLKSIISALQNPESFGFDQPENLIKKNDREKMGRQLNAFLHGPGAKLFRDGFQLDLGKMITPNTEGKIPLNVIYLNALADDKQKHFFVATLAAEIYRWMVTSLDNGKGTNLLFYIDEARDYIPAGGAKPAAKDPLIRLFTQGRKYGVACLFCTQSPRSVDYNVFGNCSTKIIGRMEAAQDIDRIAEWFQKSGPTPSWIKNRKGADPGTFVGRWPDISPNLEGKPFKGRGLYSLHEGAWSPDRLETETGEMD